MIILKYVMTYYLRLSIVSFFVKSYAKYECRHLVGQERGQQAVIYTSLESDIQLC